MGGKSSVPTPPAPVMMPATPAANYLPPKTELPEPEVVTRAQEDAEKRKKMTRLAQTDTRETTILNEGGGLGLGAVDELDQPSLYYKKKTVGTKANKGLLAA